MPGADIILTFSLSVIRRNDENEIILEYILIINIMKDGSLEGQFFPLRKSDFLIINKIVSVTSPKSPKIETFLRLQTKNSM